MKQLTMATLLLAECYVLALVLTSCGEPTSQTPSTAPEPHAVLAAPASEAALEGAQTARVEPARAASASAPAAAPATATPETTGTSAAGLTVRRLVVARDVENREPVGAGRRFSDSGEPLFAFLEMASESDEAQQIQVTFEHDGGTSVGHVTLEIPANAPRWRTWALSHNIGRAGEWRAVVRTSEGELLGELSFEII